MLSVLIPSRNDQYLQKTIDDLFAKAEGEIEIIVTLDGYWPEQKLKDHPKLKIIHQGMQHSNRGMRAGINAAAEISRGNYLMKIDEHCMVDQGFDKKLMTDCEDNWVVIPRRFRLEPETWMLIEDGRPPIDYMYLACPFVRPDDVLYGLHGCIWKERTTENSDILIDDTMSWQGSCWFMKKSLWDKLFPNGLDDEKYGTFTQEAQEIGNSVILSGGRLIVNKKTWYAHYHKGKRGKGLGFSNAQYRLHQDLTEQGRIYCIDYWLNNRWPERKHDFEWMLEKFWPIPTWPEDWKDKYKAWQEEASKNWQEYLKRKAGANSG